MKQREIKFRAWTRDKKMIYNVVPWQWDFCLTTMFHKCIESNGNGPLGSGATQGRFEVPGYSIVDGAVMQYTGSKDKNGKEIYEGDIVKIRDQYEEDETITTVDFIGGGFTIEWNSKFGMGEYDLQSVHYAMEEGFAFEVIGNEYENPELVSNGDK